MHLRNATIVAAGLATKQAMATGWTDASAFSCPDNTNNPCSSQQQTGYDWSDLSLGAFSSYGSNDFSGFTCSDTFGKRGLNQSVSASKFIAGNLDDAPSMSGSAFSIDQIQISSSVNADVDLYYGMPDGSTCKESHSCSSKASLIKNTQCGGANKVSFKPGKNAQPGCSIGVHSVGFHCGSATSTVPVYTTTSDPLSTVTVSPVSSTTATPSCYGKHCGDTSTTVAPVTSGSPFPSCYGKGCSTSPVLPVSSETPTPSCYGKHCAPSSPTVAPASTTSTTVEPTSTTSTTIAPTSDTSTTTVPTHTPRPHAPSCPDVLPRCLKTWMFLTTCDNNTDHNCFCGNKQLITNVMECLTAWSASKSEIQAAVSYLMGICAAHIPKNPAIITACPSGITPAATTTATVTRTGRTQPCTTITYSTSDLVTTVTVPKVSLSSAHIIALR